MSGCRAAKQALRPWRVLMQTARQPLTHIRLSKQHQREAKLSYIDIGKREVRLCHTNIDKRSSARRLALWPVEQSLYLQLRKHSPVPETVQGHAEQLSKSASYHSEIKSLQSCNEQPSWETRAEGGQMTDTSLRTLPATKAATIH